jgi:single-strand DNA-binding protein
LKKADFFCNFITAFKSELIYNNMSINKVILVGNVGKDPVVRYFDKGVAKATFPLATSETYTNQQGETITSTEWHNIVLWRALAEVAEKTVKKGSQLYIVGKIKTRSYVDKDGNNKYITEILGDTMVLLEKKTGPAAPNQSHDSDYGENGGNKASNDPVKSANPPSGSTAGKLVENGGSPYASDKHDNTFDEGTPGGKNEDDLPF